MPGPEPVSLKRRAAETVVATGQLSSGVRRSLPEELVEYCECLDVRIVTCSWDKRVSVWSLEEGNIVTSLASHTDWVQGVGSLSNGYVVTGSWDQTIQVHDAESGKCVAQMAGHSDCITCLVVLPGNRIVSGSDDACLRVWTSVPGTRFSSWRCQAVLSGHKERVRCLAVVDASHVVSGSNDSTLRLWNCDSAPEPGMDVACDRIDGDDDAVVACHHQKAVLTGHTSFVTCVAVVRGGCIVAGCFDHDVYVWTADLALQGRMQGHDAPVTCIASLAQHRHGVFAVSGSEDMTLRVWDVAKAACIARLTGHTGQLASVASLPDGRIISSAEDQTLRVWNGHTQDACWTTRKVWSMAVLPIPDPEAGHAGTVGGAVAGVAAATLSDRWRQLDQSSEEIVARSKHWLSSVATTLFRTPLPAVPATIPPRAIAVDAEPSSLQASLLNAVSVSLQQGLDRWC